jgi:hypothetical protein
MFSSLYLVNLPHNCTDNEIKHWVEARGFKTGSIRIIRDLIAGVSPAFAYVHLQDDSQIGEACALLTGKKMRMSSVWVSAGEDRPRQLTATASRTG